jgi:hypothetical protein
MDAQRSSPGPLVKGSRRLAQECLDGRQGQNAGGTLRARSGDRPGRDGTVFAAIDLVLMRMVYLGGAAVAVVLVNAGPDGRR